VQRELTMVTVIKDLDLVALDLHTSRIITTTSAAVTEKQLKVFRF